MAAADEIQQVGQELADIGGPNEIFEVKLADPAAQVNPQILVIENAELLVAALKHIETVVVEGGGMCRSAT